MFKKGDFIKMSNIFLEFGIFEGELVAKYKFVQFKEYSLLAHYKERKLIYKDKCGWIRTPVLEVAEEGKRCQETINLSFSSFNYTLLNDEEKSEAIKVLNSYGYEWDESTLSLIKVGEKKSTFNVSARKFDYNEEIIKPMNKEMKNRLKKMVR